jgi:choice-of-anchor C domain-containing protein
MSRTLVPVVLIVGLLALPSRGGDLPADAEKRLKEFEVEQAAIRAKAEAEVVAAREKLVKDLTVLKEGYEKAGKADDAKAVADRIAALTRDVDRAANLLVNGSFEEGPAPEGSGFVTLGADSTDMKGWKVTTGSIDHIGPLWKASHGARSLDMNGSEVGGVSQSFKTAKGQTYRVSFALSANPGVQAEAVNLKVTAAGKSEEFKYEKKDVTGENMGWTIRTWEFTATDDETTLEFTSLHPDEPFAGPALDDVIVVAMKK